LEKTKRKDIRNNKNLLVRPFEKRDIQAIYSIIRETYFRPWTPEEILLENVFSYKIVLENNTQIIGFLFGEIIFEDANILMIAVKKEFQGKGYGKLLLDSFIKAAKEKGAKKIFLEVSTENKPALKLYKKSGFKILSKRKRYYKNGDDAFLMALDIK